ncbi:MAG: hypothetical protein ABI905_04345 [Betaproteobacteria bacterium]
MPEQKFDIKPIRLLFNNTANNAAGTNADDGQDSDYLSMSHRFDGLAVAINESYRQRYGAATGPSDAIGLLAVTGDFLPLMKSLDSQHGPDSELPLDDITQAVDEALRCLAELDTWLDRLDLEGQKPAIYDLQLGIAYWAMRHRVAILAAEPVVNALAIRANAATTRQDTAAIFALMQGLVAHLSNPLKADLERSNPERPWRVLNLNFAITAIRTGDAAMMRHAFDALNAHLPDERAGFYAEASALASQPGFPPETRELIEAEHRRWTQIH